MRSSVLCVMPAQSMNLFSLLPATAVCINVWAENFCDDDFSVLSLAVCWLMYSCVENYQVPWQAHCRNLTGIPLRTLS